VISPVEARVTSQMDSRVSYNTVAHAIVSFSDLLGDSRVSYGIQPYGAVTISGFMDSVTSYATTAIAQVPFTPMGVMDSRVSYETTAIPGVGPQGVMDARVGYQTIYLGGVYTGVFPQFDTPFPYTPLSASYSVDTEPYSEVIGEPIVDMVSSERELRVRAGMDSMVSYTVTSIPVMTLTGIMDSKSSYEIT